MQSDLLDVRKMPGFGAIFYAETVSEFLGVAGKPKQTPLATKPT